MPPSLVNMARSESERRDEIEEPERSKFPFGLSLHLDSESLNKLSMASLPDVGAEFALIAKATAEAVSEFESEESGKERTLTLQITDMALESTTSQADTLFGGDNDRSTDERTT